MSNDILESVSQGGYGAYDAENRRIREISDELQRLCRLHEEESRDGKGNGGRFEIEQRIAEQYAKSVGMWIPMDQVFDLGEPGPSGNENDTYVSGTIIYKVNNLLNSGGIVKLLDKVLLHNLIFPNTAYVLHGFAGYDNRSVMPVLMQRRIRNAQPATQIMIDTVTVVSENTVAYDSEIYTLSRFCKHFMPDEDSENREYQGPAHFLYNGKTLDDIRKEKEKM